MFPCWVTPNNDALVQVVYGTVSGEVPELTPTQNAEALLALEAATEILSRLTGRVIHGPGTAVDQYTTYGTVRSLKTTFTPIREVHSLYALGKGDEAPEALQLFWTGSSTVRLTRPFKCSPRREILELTYRFGSTVTAGARSTLLYYAHQLFQAGPLGDPELCQLPERVTSITREGISMTTLDPQTFLDRGLTGLIRVDEWLSGYAAGKATRRAGIFAVDSPPPVNVSVECGV